VSALYGGWYRCRVTR